nr:MerR family DNA-binding protein [Paenibacillus sp. MMS18-CY102]
MLAISRNGIPSSSTPSNREPAGDCSTARRKIEAASRRCTASQRFEPSPTYSETTIERLKLIRKFQSIGCSLAELKDVLQDHDANTRTNQQIMEWIIGKMIEIERKKDGYDQMLETLRFMLEYRKTLETDPQRPMPC